MPTPVVVEVRDHIQRAGALSRQGTAIIQRSVDGSHAAALDDDGTGEVVVEVPTDLQGGAVLNGGGGKVLVVEVGADGQRAVIDQHARAGVIDAVVVVDQRSHDGRRTAVRDDQSAVEAGVVEVSADVQGGAVLNVGGGGDLVVEVGADG